MLCGLAVFFGGSVLADPPWDQGKGKWMAQWGQTFGPPRYSQIHIEDSGRAKYPGGEIYFNSANDLTWEGQWKAIQATESCTEEKHGSYHWGVVKITFNDSYDQFEGTWDNCGDGKTNILRGKRE